MTPEVEKTTPGGPPAALEHPPLGGLKQVKIGVIFLEERFSDATIFSQIKFDCSFAFLLGRKFVCPSLHLWNDVVGKSTTTF